VLRPAKPGAAAENKGSQTDLASAVKQPKFQVLRTALPGAAPETNVK
jgi:hypothetical protein